MIALSTENILLQAKCKGLENALLNEKKRRKHGKPLLIDFQSSQDGGAIFYSPSKIQQARELQTEKEEAAQIIRTQKAEEKLHKEQEKEEKRRLIEERNEVLSANVEGGAPPVVNQYGRQLCLPQCYRI